MFVYKNGEFQREEEKGIANPGPYSSYEDEEEEVPPEEEEEGKKNDPLQKQLVWTD